jgi:hypothetical protein
MSGARAACRRADAGGCNRPRGNAAFRFDDLLYTALTLRRYAGSAGRVQWRHAPRHLGAPTQEIDMNAIKLAIAGIALAGVFGAASAEARGRDDVQFSVTIGSPAPVYAGPVLVRSYDRGYGPRHPHPVYRHAPRPTRWDRDGDGVPNRFDRVYNPRWDRDGDGVPNRYDRRDDRRYGRH